MSRESGDDGAGAGNTVATRADKPDNGRLARLRQRINREFLDIETRTDISEEEKVSQLTHITCATCAGIAIQPIPFADIFILTPVQAFAGSRIAAVRGVPVTESEVSHLIKEIAGVVGLGLIAQQLAIGFLKIFFPGGGGFVTIPLVYGLTYAICSVMDAYFVAKRKGRKLSPNEIREKWEQAKKTGERKGKAREADIKNEDNDAQ